MKVRISSEAELDLADGYWFYENQVAGLGDKFREQLKRDIRSLEIDGGSHSKQYGHHRKVCTKFPFSVFHRMDTKTDLTVVAVFSQRRGEKWIANRLKT